MIDQTLLSIIHDLEIERKYKSGDIVCEKKRGVRNVKKLKWEI